MYVFRSLQAQAWFVALARLDAALAAHPNTHPGAVALAYEDLFAALAEAGAGDLWEAAASGLLYLESPLASSAPPPPGLRAGAARDVAALLSLLRRDWRAEVAAATEEAPQALPPLTQLGGAPDARVSALAAALRRAAPADILEELTAQLRAHGAGPLARHQALRWADGALHGVAHPAQPDAARLVALEGVLARLFANTEAFLAGRGAPHMLLYGARGSGKSTALRSLGPRYAAQGLRLVEVAPGDLGALPRILELLRGRPHRYLLFADDLSFDLSLDQGAAYAPLKSLLEGSLVAPPDNVLVAATSNRRHLVSERFSDRPDPSDDDPHAWDTQHERLALADRFGLVLTFPDATQRRYLEITRALAAQAGVALSDAEAIRFAAWGNGYSGRTAQQCVAAFKAGLARPAL